MKVSLAEFKTGIEEYLEKVEEETIVITKDGLSIAQLTPPPKDKLTILESLCGILPSTASEAEARQERLARYESGL